MSFITATGMYLRLWWSNKICAVSTHPLSIWWDHGCAI